MNTELKNIVSEFAIEGNVIDIAPLGNGLINDTYKVKTDGPKDYVLQHINTAVFPDVEMLQNNIKAVTGHIRRKLIDASETNIDRKVLNFIPLKNSEKTYTVSADGKYWRISVFIDDAITYETVNPEYSRFAGLAFGNFEAMLADLPETIGEVIPNFHNIEFRLQQLVDAVKEDRVGRMAEPEVKEILADIDNYGEAMCKGEKMFREGSLCKRICHCDTKVNNMLFDNEGKVLCVIDLDTVMPSFVFSDFGDFLRYAANPVMEDSPELDKIDFRMDIFKAFTEGYIEGTKSFLTPVEKSNLPYAACLFPYMQAVRFFADYINGDTYYRINYPDHNLVRTRNQMKLFHSAFDKVPEMTYFIDSLK